MAANFQPKWSVCQQRGSTNHTTIKVDFNTVIVEDNFIVSCKHLNRSMDADCSILAVA